MSSCAVLEETNFSFAEAEIKAISPLHKASKKYQSDKFAIKSGSLIERNDVQNLKTLPQERNAKEDVKSTYSVLPGGAINSTNHSNRAQPPSTVLGSNETSNYEKRSRKLQQLNGGSERNNWTKTQSKAMENTPNEVRKKVIKPRPELINGVNENARTNTKMVQCTDITNNKREVKKKLLNAAKTIIPNQDKKAITELKQPKNEVKGQLKELSETNTKANHSAKHEVILAQKQNNQSKNYEQEILRLQQKMAKLQNRIAQMQSKVIKLQSGIK